MSTRGVIARLEGAHPPQFCGVYHHWDSYPSGLGHTLWKLYHEQFERNLKVLTQVLLDEHPAGWSTINGADFSLAAGFIELMSGSGPAENHSAAATRGESVHEQSQGLCPECYCHGDRAEAAWQVTEQNAAGSGCEWAYAFFSGDTPEHDIMLVLSSFQPSGRKMIGYFGQGDPQSVWAVVAVVGLQGQEPDWEALNRASPLEPLRSFAPYPCRQTSVKRDEKRPVSVQEGETRKLEA